jgi:four helix bundle protein
MSKDFRKLKVWEKSHQLTLAAYRATIPFPKEEIYGLTSQIRRSSSSIAANIAEGCCRSGNSEFSRFLQIAMGSASELEYHWILAHDLGYLKDPDYDQLTKKTIEVKQMLSSFIRKLKTED